MKIWEVYLEKGKWAVKITAMSKTPKLAYGSSEPVQNK